MTQNGPYPGPPSQPWSTGDSAEPYPAPAQPYVAPADPWGDHSGHGGHEQSWGAHPTSIPPDPGSSAGHHAAPPWNTPPPAWNQPPPPPPPQRRNMPIVALVVVLGLLVCGGLGTTAWLLNERGAASADGLPASLPPTVPATDDAADPEPRSSADARFVAKGQCVRNEGTTERPEMKILPCATGTYEVLKRVDGRTTGEADAEQKCAKVEKYTKWYFYDSELDSLDFVLCLRERTT